ncbi:unnamed protein product [Brassica oleracea var. botrytis]
MLTPQTTTLRLVDEFAEKENTKEKFSRCRRLYGISLQFQLGDSVFHPMKQRTPVMAPLVISSSPPHLRPSSPSSHLRSPPDPPPCTPPPVPLEVLSPPKPPDPHDASFGPVFLLLFDTSFDPAQALSRTSDLESLLLNLAFVTGDGVVSLMSIGDKVFASKCLYPAVCSLFLCRCLDWNHDLIFPAKSSMLKIRDTSNAEVLIKGFIAMLRIVNCALVAVSISGFISLIVVSISQGFISLSSLMFEEIRGLLYDISCLSVLYAPILICCICHDGFIIMLYEHSLYL